MAGTGRAFGGTGEYPQVGKFGPEHHAGWIGAWAIGGTGYDFAWGKQDDADSIAAVHRSLELGVNWIDTAPVYDTGHSEERVASALKEWRRSRPYVFTKCVVRRDEKGALPRFLIAISIRRECDDSLRFTLVFVIDDIAEGRDSPSAGQK